MDVIIDEPISEEVLKEILDLEAKADAADITAYLCHLMQHYDLKAAFILPHYTANLYTPNENGLDQLKMNPNPEA
uniref:Uncharacterized protein n=1 Tax=Acrobeloides nanus TaxID=290746 RepID=A0A914CKD8_9BILA